MKKIHYKIILLCFLCSTNLIYSQKQKKNNFFDIVNQKTTEFDNKAKTLKKSSLKDEKILAKERKKFARWQWFWQTRIDKNGDFGTYAKELFDTSNITNLKKNKTASKKIMSPGLLLNSSAWSIIGPEAFPAGTDPDGIIGIGRVDAIITNPNNSNHVIIGARNGGIWETYNINNTSPTWACLTNDLPISAVNDLKIINNILYASTSNVNATLFEASSKYGIGVIKKSLSSTEWQISNEKFNSIKIAISKNNQNIIYSIGRKEIHKSTDAGNSWIKLPNIPNAENSNVILTHIEVNPNNPNNVIITGRHNKWSSYNSANTVFNTLIYKTTDGGNSWANITDNLESFINTTFTTNGSIDSPINLGVNGGTSIATCSYNDSLFLSVNYQYSNSKYRNYIVKLNSTWNGFQFFNTLGQNWPYNNKYFYETDDVPIVFQVVSSSEILTGNRSFRVIKNNNHSITDYYYGSNAYALHQDIRTINYDANIGRLLIGTDGGINKAFDNNNNLNFPSFPVASGNLNLFLAFNMSYINKNGTRTIRIGNQDTGYYRSDNTGMGWNGWTRFGNFGEGQTYTDPINPNIIYRVDKRDLMKSTNGGIGDDSFSHTGIKIGSYSTGPFEINPNNSNQMVFDNIEGNNTSKYPLSLSNNQANSAIDISNGVSKLQIGINTALELSKTTPSILYVSRMRGPLSIYGINNSLFKSTNIDFNNTSSITYTDLTANINAIDPSIMSSAYITDIEIDDTNENKVWMTFGNLEKGKKIYHTSDGGSNWTNISSNLPNIPTNVVEYDSVNNKLYIGNDYGVYALDNTSGFWSRYGEGLPVAIVTSIEIDNNVNELIASTHGRSVWTAPLINCSNYIVSSSQVWSSDRKICGDLIIENGASLYISNSLIEANNIIMKDGSSLYTNAFTELRSNYYNSNSKFNHHIKLDSNSIISFNTSTTLSNYNVDVVDSSSIRLIGHGNITMNHSKINILNNANYNHNTSANVILSDIDSSINFFENYNFGVFGNVTKIDEIKFSGIGSLNILNTTNINLQNLNLNLGRKYNFDSDQYITIGDDLGFSNFTINNANVTLKAGESIIIKPNTTIDSENFLAFVDNDNITNYNKKSTKTKEYSVEKKDFISDNLLINSLKVYPNPTSEYLNITPYNNSKNLITDFTITNTNGKVMFKGSLGSESLELNISNYKKGVYI